MYKDGVYLTEFGWPDAIAFVLYVFVAISWACRIRKAGSFWMRLFLLISVEHLLITIGYWYYSLTQVADATKYFSKAQAATSLITQPGQGGGLIIATLQLLIHVFKLSYVGSYFVFSLFGLFGFYLLLKLILYLCEKYHQVVKREYLYFLLLPGIHFWSSAIGKDSMIFMFIVCMIYGLFAPKPFLFIIGAVGTGFIRSHVLLMIIVGIGGGYIFLNKKLNVFQKVLLMSLTIAAMIVVTPLVVKLLGLKSLSVDALEGFIDKQQTYNQSGGSSVNMTGASFPVKLLSYLFRPFFFDAHNVVSFLSSIENTAWIYMFYRLSMYFRRKMFHPVYSALYAPLFFGFLVPLFGLASALNNLGIAVRQKTMCFPFIFLLFILSSWFDKLLESRHRKTIQRGEGEFEVLTISHN